MGRHAMDERYQAWVIRAWPHALRGDDRLTIEEVETGRVVELHGPRAVEIRGVISTAATHPDQSGGDARVPAEPGLAPPSRRRAARGTQEGL